MSTDAVIRDLDVLTPEEARAEVEAEIRKHLGMSYSEFLRSAQDDTLPDLPIVPHLVLLTGARTGTRRGL